MAKIKGTEYVSKDEKYNNKLHAKDIKGLKTAGIATELKESRKETGYSKILPKVKPQKKKSAVLAETLKSFNKR